MGFGPLQADQLAEEHRFARGAGLRRGLAQPRFHHAGILVVRYDNNPRNNMSSGDIARTVRNLEKAGVSIADSYHELNHWK